MKADRSPVTRAAAALLAGLLLTAGHPAAGGPFRVKVGRLNISYESHTKQLAQALALEIKGVQTRFADSRRALSTLKGPDGQPAYLRKDVSDLIDRTGKDLDAAIVKVQPSNLQPLRDWVADELGRVQGELPPAPGTASLFAPQPVALIASLGAPPKKKPASPKAASPKPAAPPAPPPPDTVPADKSNGILEEVGKVVDRIFFLASHNDLEVKLWVGSTAPHATFSFWPQGRLKGDSAPAPTVIRMDGKKGGVLRGLYVYKAAWTQGKVTQIIEYPPVGAQTTPTERLDLVNGTGFFCCRFDEQFCHAVASEKECRS